VTNGCGIERRRAFLRSEIKDMTRLMDQCLLWLHEHRWSRLGPRPDVFPPGDNGASESQGRGGLPNNTSRRCEALRPKTTNADPCECRLCEKGPALWTSAQRLLRITSYVDVRPSCAVGFRARAEMPDGRPRPARGKPSSCPRKNTVQQANRPRMIGNRPNVLVTGGGPGNRPDAVLGVHRHRLLDPCTTEDTAGILVSHTTNRHAAPKFANACAA